MVFGTIIGIIISFISSILIRIFYFEIALATGAAMPIMMWLFQSVINSLVSIGKGNTTTTSPNWYTQRNII